ncbi:hypothetical protein GCM10009837_11520 [Streptomyces durmitorensis]
MTAQGFCRQVGMRARVSAGRELLSGLLAHDGVDALTATPASAAVDVHHVAFTDALLDQPVRGRWFALIAAGPLGFASLCLCDRSVEPLDPHGVPRHPARAAPARGR